MSVQRNPDDDPSTWVSYWKKNEARWHMADVNRYLVKYFNYIQAGRDKIKILVPLCGKTLDMIWLYKQGHTVIGVEFAEKPCIDFFTEQGLAYSKSEVPQVKGSVFKSDDGQLKLYCCDLFLFTSDIEGLFDGIWDRGSFVALADKKRYCQHLQTLMSPCCRTLMEVFEYDPSLHSGSPYPSTIDDVKEAFGEKCLIQRVVKSKEEDFGKKLFGFEEFYICMYLVNLKVMKEYMEQHHQGVTDTTADYWVKRWDIGMISFDQSSVNKNLINHYDKLLNGRTSLKILVPLCGKAVVIPWLYERGHTVVGIEISPKAIEEFFAESGKAFTKERVDSVDGYVYKTADGRIKMYCCDLYNFTRDTEGLFDAFWDRGSYCAITLAEREKYRKLMTSLVAPGFTSLVVTPDYDTRLYPGPPHSVSYDDMKILYGDKTEKIELVDSDKALRFGVDDFTTNTYFYLGK